VHRRSQLGKRHSGSRLRLRCRRSLRRSSKSVKPASRPASSRKHPALAARDRMILWTWIAAWGSKPREPRRTAGMRAGHYGLQFASPAGYRREQAGAEGTGKPVDDPAARPACRRGPALAVRWRLPDVAEGYTLSRQSHLRSSVRSETDYEMNGRKRYRTRAGEANSKRPDAG